MNMHSSRRAAPSHSPHGAGAATNPRHPHRDPGVEAPGCGCAAAGGRPREASGPAPMREGGKRRRGKGKKEEAAAITG